MARKGGHPEIAKIGKPTRFNTLDGVKEKMGSKIFSVRIPESYQEKLLSYSQKERVSLMRSSIMNAIDEHENEQN